MHLLDTMKTHMTRNVPRRSSSARLWAVLSVALIACGGSGSSTPVDPPTPPPTVCTPGNGTVCLTKSNTFDPASMTVAVGSTVTWMNTTGVTHNVTFDTQGSPSNIPSFASGAQTATFPTKGTFAYHCTIHGASMSGTITVQ